MHTVKTSRKRSISARKRDVAKFEIVGKEVKGIPSVRVSLGSKTDAVAARTPATARD
jgi:hypothetical protein